MNYALDPSAIPDMLTDAEARALIEQIAPRARKISEDIVRNNARAEQGQAQMVALQAKARETFNTDDLTKMGQILEERKTKNAVDLRNFVVRLLETEAKLAKVAQSATMR